MASDSNEISANKGLPVTLSDSDFGESDRVEMCHLASAQSSLGFISHTSISVAVRMLSSSLTSSPLLKFIL